MIINKLKMSAKKEASEGFLAVDEIIEVDGIKLSPSDAIIFMENLKNGGIKSSQCTINSVYSSIEVIGNVHTTNTISGDVRIAENVSKSANTVSGSIIIKGSVGGHVSTVSGSIR